MHTPTRSACLLFWVAFCGPASPAVTIDTVPVGNPGNSGERSGDGAAGGGMGDSRICGGVDYAYRMGKYEVTAAEYVEFLNAVARTDPYGLYHAGMDTTIDPRGCDIRRTGTAGGYTYAVAADWANRPANYISWGSAARFCNWMHNGQPTGSLSGIPTLDAQLTEDGSYWLNGTTDDSALLSVTRKANASWALPSEDEWYKAAYYDPDKPGGSGYWDYPTRSNARPSNVLSAAGNNNANFYDEFSRRYTLDAPYYRTEVGAFGNSPSAYGTYDQGGNVWEWSEGVAYGVYRGLRGGSFDRYGYGLLAANRNANYSTTEDYWGGGLRVALVPEPATPALIAIGVLAACRRRRTVESNRQAAKIAKKH